MLSQHFANEVFIGANQHTIFPSQTIKIFFIGSRFIQRL